MTISEKQISTLSSNQAGWAKRWNSEIAAWKATVAPSAQAQIDRMVRDKDLALLAAFTDIVRIIRGEAPMNPGQGDNDTTGANGIGGEKISTKEVFEPTGGVDKKGQPLGVKHSPIWSFRFPYLNKNRLQSAGGDGVWRVIMNNERKRVLGIFDYHGAGMKAWKGEGISEDTAS